MSFQAGFNTCNLPYACLQNMCKPMSCYQLFCLNLVVSHIYYNIEITIMDNGRLESKKLCGYEERSE